MVSNRFLFSSRWETNINTNSFFIFHKQAETENVMFLYIERVYTTSRSRKQWLADIQVYNPLRAVHKSKIKKVKKKKLKS